MDDGLKQTFPQVRCGVECERRLLQNSRFLQRLRLCWFGKQWATMSFETEGFFSPEIEGFRRNVRDEQPTKAWFDYALDLNRLGFDMLRRVDTLLADNRQFSLNAHFVSVHQSFQSALLLAERGLVPDARVVLRSGVESAIAANALANDANFVERMIDAHYRSQRTLARVMLDKFRADLSPAEIIEMEKANSEAGAREVANGGKELTDIKWEQVAEKHCKELYHLLYRSLSSDGTHATINVLERFLVVDGAGEITAFKVAPDGAGLVETLSAACLMFIWAADPYADTNGLADMSAAITVRVQQFATLPDAFPRRGP